MTSPPSFTQWPRMRIQDSCPLPRNEPEPSSMLHAPPAVYSEKQETGVPSCRKNKTKQNIFLRGDKMASLRVTWAWSFLRAQLSLIPPKHGSCAPCWQHALATSESKLRSWSSCGAKPRKQLAGWIKRVHSGDLESTK